MFPASGDLDLLRSDQLKTLGTEPKNLPENLPTQILKLAGQIVGPELENPDTTAVRADDVHQKFAANQFVDDRRDSILMEINPASHHTDEIPFRSIIPRGLKLFDDNSDSNRFTSSNCITKTFPLMDMFLSFLRLFLFVRRKNFSVMTGVLMEL